MRRFRPDQKIGIEIDGSLAAGGGIEPDRNRGGRRRVEEGVHTKRLRDVRIVCEEHLAERHRLQRFFGGLAQHGRGPVADLLPGRRRIGGARGIPFSADNIV